MKIYFLNQLFISIESSIFFLVVNKIIRPISFKKQSGLHDCIEFAHLVDLSTKIFWDEQAMPSLTLALSGRGTWVPGWGRRRGQTGRAGCRERWCSAKWAEGRCKPRSKWKIICSIFAWKLGLSPFSSKYVSKHQLFLKKYSVSTYACNLLGVGLLSEWPWKYGSLSPLSRGFLYCTCTLEYL